MKKLSFFAAAVILLAGCTQAPKNEYVKLSDAACTFRAADNLPQTVRVNASGSWTAESGASWLTVEQQADALVLTVADNDTDYDRSTEILIASGRAEASISVSQLAADSNIARLRVLKTFSRGTVMSKSGRCPMRATVTTRSSSTSKPTNGPRPAPSRPLCTCF